MPTIPGSFLSFKQWSPPRSFDAICFRSHDWHGRPDSSKDLGSPRYFHEFGTEHLICLMK
jgi:hypothetical protein